jgi:putative transposase
MPHSDRVSQYASHTVQNKFKKFGMTRAMSRKVNRRDNAPADSWFNSFKKERYHAVSYASQAEMKPIEPASIQPLLPVSNLVS